jgi:ornithine cyclodeaminase/alanine dehydrogenase-like protein (mu-crystallin family)
MIFLSRAEALRLSDPAGMIAEIKAVFSSQRELPPRCHYDLPGSGVDQMLVMPGWIDRELLGLKVATVIPSNAEREMPTIEGLCVLLDGATGVAIAIISGSALTELRTAAVSAVATSILAREDSETLLIIGTGSLLPHLIQAHLCVRPLKKIIVWGRNLAKSQAIVDGLKGAEYLIESASDLNQAIAHADIIVSATSARSPLIFGSSLKEGTHVDLIGSFRPDMMEADPAVFLRSKLAVDTRSAFAESGDLIPAAEKGWINPASTPDLHDIIIRGSSRRTGRDITVFKSIGTALADLAAARHLFHSARAQSLTAPFT